MPRPRFCRNPRCRNSRNPPPGWLARAGHYPTAAHGLVQRYVCTRCGKGMGEQTESMHYYAKRRLKLAEILSRLRGGSSLRDIGRELGCSRTAVANAVVRLARQAMACHVDLLSGLPLPGRLVFDGLASSVTGHDYPSQIHTLVDGSVELLLAMTHYVGPRGGTITVKQLERIKEKYRVWSPQPGALKDSIALLVNELTAFAAAAALLIDTDEYPLYPPVIEADLALRWYREAGLLEVRRTPGTAERTASNPLFPVNYVDRMIRHRMKEHTRETIAGGRNSTMQMMRMWIFAWDHNVRQPHRVEPPADECRAAKAGVSTTLLRRLKREFYHRRRSVRRHRVPESMRQVWLAGLATPPVRWVKGQASYGPGVPQYASLDLSFSRPAG